MSRRWFPCFALLVLFLVSSPATRGEEAGVRGPVSARVLRVLDGDTLNVMALIWVGQAVETMVRLRGVDAPETGGRARCSMEREKGEAAKTLLGRMVSNKTVRLFEVKPDKYGGRVLARVETESGRDVGQALLSSGLVRPYDGRARQPWCDE